MILKHAFLAFVLTALAAVVVAEPYSVDVGPTSTMVLPLRRSGTIYGQAWTTNLPYSQGDIVTNASKAFWCVVAGTSTNVAGAAGPNVASGSFADGTVTWRRLFEGPRSGFAIIHDDTNAACYFSIGYTAVYQTGVRLTANGGSWTSENGSIQNPINAISAPGTTNRIVVLEW